jgi:hypothetical protein
MKIDRWINTNEELIAFRNEHRMREDWHEPDEQGIDCFLRDGTFDNAHCDDGEAHVILYNSETTETVAVNLALLLAWATGYRGYL